MNALMALKASNWLGVDVYDARLIEGAWYVRTSDSSFRDSDGLYGMFHRLSDKLKGIDGLYEFRRI